MKDIVRKTNAEIATARGRNAYFYNVSRAKIRIIRARRSRGVLQFKALNTGKWLDAGDEWEIVFE